MTYNIDYLKYFNILEETYQLLYAILYVKWKVQECLHAIAYNSQTGMLLKMHTWKYAYVKSLIAVQAYVAYRIYSIVSRMR